MIKKFIVIYFLEAFFCRPLFAQQCQIKGAVGERNKTTMLDSVRIEIYEGKLMYKIIYTDAQGRYDTRMFQVINDVSFNITRNGFEKQLIQFGKLKGNNVIFMDIFLDRISVEKFKKQKEKEDKKAEKNKTRKKRYARPGRRSFLPF
jgi:hypothetical protein